MCQVQYQSNQRRDGCTVYDINTYVTWGDMIWMDVMWVDMWWVYGVDRDKTQNIHLWLMGNDTNNTLIWTELG